MTIPSYRLTVRLPNTTDFKRAEEIQEVLVDLVGSIYLDPETVQADDGEMTHKVGLRKDIRGGWEVMLQARLYSPVATFQSHLVSITKSMLKALVPEHELFEVKSEPFALKENERPWNEYY